MNVTTVKTIDADVIILLVLMAGAWGLLGFDLWQIVSQPALSAEGRYTRGWEMLWAFALAIITWLLMGLVLYRLRTPGSLVIFLVSLAGAFCAVQLMDDGATRWPAILPVLLPVLFTGAALSGSFATMRWGVLAVALVPCVVVAGTAAMDTLGKNSQRRAIYNAARQQNLPIVQTISEAQPLWTWLPQLEEESGVREETLAALRHLKRRQNDIEQMLGNRDGIGDPLALVPELDLAVTPNLQKLINARALQDAEYARTMPGGGDEILERTFIYASLPAMHWLHDHGGDCREGISELKAAVLLYRDTPIRRKLVKELDGMLN